MSSGLPLATPTSLETVVLSGRADASGLPVRVVVATMTIAHAAG